MKPPDDDAGQEGRETPTVVPQLSIIVALGVAAVAIVAVWPDTAPAVELAITLLAMLLDAVRRTYGSPRDR